MSSLMSKVSRLIGLIFIVQCALLLGGYFWAASSVKEKETVQEISKVASLDPHTLEELALYIITHNEMAKNVLLYDIVQKKDLTEVVFIPTDDYREDRTRYLETYSCTRVGSKTEICEDSHKQFIASFLPVFFDGKLLGQLYQRSLKPKTATGNFLKMGTLALVVLLASVIFNIVGVYVFFKHRVNSELGKLISLITSKKEVGKKSECQIKEFAIIEKAIEEARSESIEKEKMKTSYLIEKQKNLMARQVAHDIRSPLSALDVAIKSSDGIAEDYKKIVNAAVDRIHDIANNLLDKTSVQDDAKNKLAIEFIPSLISSIVSEKRIPLSSRPGIEIDFSLTEESYGQFAMVNAADFKRIMSNLIDNALDAIDVEGKIKIKVCQSLGQVIIKVQDSGKGIPADILPQIKQQNFTYQKSQGTGLGLYHADQTIKKWEGKLTINSVEDQGTEVMIHLPKSSVPQSFVETIRLRPDQTLVIVDDDRSIHHLWRQRISKLPVSIKVLSYYSPDSFRRWFESRDDGQDYFILMDYEFLGHKSTGLDLIKAYKLFENAFLVTSCFEDKKVQKQCEKYSLGLIDKQMAGVVPFCLERHREVLIDDDPLVRAVWEAKAKHQKIDFQAYASFEDFSKSKSHFSKDTTIYIDSDLNEIKRGEDYAEDLSQEGFSDLYLATGHEDINKAARPYLKGVLGKEPPWLGEEII